MAFMYCFFTLPVSTRSVIPGGFHPLPSHRTMCRVLNRARMLSCTTPPTCYQNRTEKENTAPFGVNWMGSQVLHRAAQEFPSCLTYLPSCMALHVISSSSSSSRAALMSISSAQPCRLLAVSEGQHAIADAQQHSVLGRSKDKARCPTEA